ncbi:hypothetical protein SEUCBS139899_010396 [Sporothrix eucalyptigena]|uniref:Succinylglutamate desuccinylase/Aspartoacylase catalytic domain-containing protein n=1 Tax=Sporothrix eucalyptigena TaxID=1812306 RepID=A0ABP0BPG0_9PEZI
MAPSVLNESLENGDSCSDNGHALPQVDKAESHANGREYAHNVTKISSLDVTAIPTDTACRYQLSLTSTALGSVDIPIFAYRSKNPGPTVGITCAIHGNEVNGIPVIQQLFRDMEGNVSNEHAASHLPAPERLHVERGTIIGIPVANVPGFLASIRCFDEDSKQDLNRLMPGKKDGSAPQQYVYAIFNKVIVHIDYLIDLHTASLGRRNSLYVRADMNHPEIAKLARLLQPQIVVHVSTEGSLRGCAQARGIRALTVEIGNPSVFQTHLIRRTYTGIRRVLSSLMMAPEYTPSTVQSLDTEDIQPEAVLCNRSYWTFTSTGGILRIFKDVAQIVQPGELVAEIQTIFGDVIERIHAPDYETVVVGVEDNPVAKTGSRVIHLGVVGNVFGSAVGDGHL